MPWVIGIDEAGYGPNLGPLVQAAAWAKLPESDLAGWDWFGDKIRRVHEPKDSRLLVDDSKKVHANGSLTAFKTTLSGWGESGLLADLVAECGVLDSKADFESEYWPAKTSLDVLPPPVCPIREIGLHPSRLHVVTATRLNKIIQQTDSKAPALMRGYVGLIQSTFQFLFDSQRANLLEGEDAVIITDKLGGRHYYAPLLQEAFPQGWVIAECETPAESRYRVENLPFKVTAIFRPKADSGSICVALASMMAKYVREMCMQEFNAFWAKHVPGLQPTAGYPVDAKRFYREIEPAMQALGIPADEVWRIK